MSPTFADSISMNVQPSVPINLGGGGRLREDKDRPKHRTVLQNTYPNGIHLLLPSHFAGPLVCAPSTLEHSMAAVFRHGEIRQQQEQCEEEVAA